MSWTVTGMTADLIQNQATVMFSRSSGISTPYWGVNVTFQLTTQPPAETVTRDALIRQAQQILIDAGNASVEG